MYVINAAFDFCLLISRIIEKNCSILEMTGLRSLNQGCLCYYQDNNGFFMYMDTGQRTNDSILEDIQLRQCSLSAHPCFKYFF